MYISVKSMTTIWNTLIRFCSLLYLGFRVGIVLRALASHKCGPGDSASYLGWVCWFSTLHREVFSGYSSFSLSSKTNIWLDLICVNLLISVDSVPNWCSSARRPYTYIKFLSFSLLTKKRQTFGKLKFPLSLKNCIFRGTDDWQELSKGNLYFPY